MTPVPNDVASSGIRTEEALKKCFNQHYRGLRKFANEMIKNNLEADDIVVNSFVKLWERGLCFQSDQEVKSYLYVSVRNACYNYLQARKVRQNSHKEILYMKKEMDHVDLEASISFKLIESKIVNALVGELEKLPPRMKTIVDMIRLGRTTGEISRELKLSDATVRVQKSRAVNAIRGALVRQGLLTFIAISIVGAELTDGRAVNFCTGLGYQ